MILPSAAQLWPMALMLTGIGVLAGLVAGLLGVGGGFLLVPAFLYAFTALGYGSELVMQVCLATSLATIVVTSLRGLAAHNRRGAVDWAILRGWAPALALGAVVGVLVAGSLETRALLLIFGVLGTLGGLNLALGAPEARLAKEMPRGAARWGLGGAIGFVAVLMGIGGAMFGVPLMRLCGVPMHRAVGTAVGFGLAIAVPGVATFLAHGWGEPGRPPFTLGLVNLPAFLIVIAMTLMVTPLGVRAAHALDALLLRRLFAAFVIAMALNLLRLGLAG